MVHGEGGQAEKLFADRTGGIAYYRRIGFYVFEYDRAGANFGAFAHFDVAQDFGAGADQDAVADFGMTIATFLAGAAQGDCLEDRNFIFDHGGFADHEAGAVVDQYSPTEARRRMDIDGEAL